MPTLNELMTKFASPSGDDAAPVHSQPAARGHNKHASAEGDKTMGNGTLQDIYLAISDRDQEKTAAAAAFAPGADDTDEGDVDFAKIAEQIADQEASDQVEQESGDGTDMVKVAAEYDAAGRIMARGFFDEFSKLAANADGQTDAPSEAKTPALGERGVPTLATNYVGTVDTGNAGKQPQMNGAEPKKVYSDSLATTKTISAGQGTGDDPEAAALSLGGGSPSGFATIRDLQA